MKRPALALSLLALLPSASAFAAHVVGADGQSAVAPLSRDGLTPAQASKFIPGVRIQTPREALRSLNGDVQHHVGLWNGALGECWHIAAAAEVDRSIVDLAKQRGTTPVGILEQIVTVHPERGTATVKLGDIFANGGKPAADGYFPAKSIEVPLGYYADGHRKNLLTTRSANDLASLVGAAIAKYRIEHEAQANLTLPVAQRSTTFTTRGVEASRGGNAVDAFRMFTRRDAKILTGADFAPTAASLGSVMKDIDTARTQRQPIVVDSPADQDQQSDALGRIKTAVDNGLLAPAALKIARIADIGVFANHSFRLLEGAKEQELSPVQLEFMTSRGLLVESDIRRDAAGKTYARVVTLREIGGTESIGDKTWKKTRASYNLGMKGGVSLLPEKAFAALFSFVHIGTMD